MIGKISVFAAIGLIKSRRTPSRWYRTSLGRKEETGVMVN